VTYHFAPEAVDEYIGATAHYSQVRQELARSFVEEVERGIASILEYPRAYPLVVEDVRRYLIRRFPFALFYTIESDNTIWIVAVGQVKRQQDYWKDRVP